MNLQLITINELLFISYRAVKMSSTDKEDFI